MIQPLVELYGGCMVVLKVSWCGITGLPVSQAHRVRGCQGISYQKHEAALCQQSASS